MPDTGAPSRPAGGFPRGRRRAAGVRASAATVALGLAALGCRTAHEPTVVVAPETRAGAAAPPAWEADGELPGLGVPAEVLAGIPMSSTGIVLLRPLAPPVPVKGGAVAGEAEEADEEAEVVLLREGWVNPVARGGVTAANVGLRMDAVRFAYDSADLEYAARRSISRYAAWLREHPEVHLTLEGHCDERGSSQYNYNLAMARAWTVKDLLIGLGVEAERVFTISYGEEQPIARGSMPEAWALNRRVEFRPFYPVRDGQVLSTLQEGVPEGAERGVPPPQPALVLEGEDGAWPPLEDRGPAE